MLRSIFSKFSATRNSVTSVSKYITNTNEFCHSFSTIKLFDENTKFDSFETTNNGIYEGKLMLSDKWSISKIPNGGYTAAVAISAARKAINPDLRDVMVLHGMYIKKSDECVESIFRTRVISESKNMAVVSVDLIQHDQLRSTYMLTLGRMKREGDNNDSISFHGPGMTMAPSLPPPEQCIPASDLIKDYGGSVYTIYDNVEIVIPPDDPCAGLFQMPQNMGKEMNTMGWMRFRDGRHPCLRSTSLFLDAHYPPVINVFPSTWVPTLAIDMNFWGRPSQACKDEGGWVRVRFGVQHMQNGLFYEDGEVWDGVEDRLLGSSRQFAKFLMPRKK
jgi:acyl-CoA thioesterase